MIAFVSVRTLGFDCVDIGKVACLPLHLEGKSFSRAFFFAFVHVLSHLAWDHTETTCLKVIIVWVLAM